MTGLLRDAKVNRVVRLEDRILNTERVGVKIPGSYPTTVSHGRDFNALHLRQSTLTMELQKDLGHSGNTDVSAS